MDEHKVKPPGWLVEMMEVAAESVHDERPHARWLFEISNMAEVCLKRWKDGQDNSKQACAEKASPKKCVDPEKGNEVVVCPNCDKRAGEPLTVMSDTEGLLDPFQPGPAWYRDYTCTHCHYLWRTVERIVPDGRGMRGQDNPKGGSDG